MTRAGMRAARPPRASSGAQTLIHRNKVPNPALARVPAVRYSIEWGVSPAVVEAAFLIAIRLQEGGYARST